MQRNPLLATKLFAPPSPPGEVRRPRLLERMHEGARGRLTLLSAPAGFGKTTLASAWAHATDLPVAWLSLDEEDADPARFLAYLITALREVGGELGADALAALASPRPPPLPSLVNGLLNELTGLSHDVAVVLDDYHAADDRSVDELVGLLADRSPPRVHLIVSTREDPDLPLARLRARGHLTELRAADLRFTPEEAVAFFDGHTGDALSVAAVEALESRTEGWIAGLQLAALSLRGRDDATAFVRAFAGDHRHVADYLVDEVLRRQPDDVREFLLATSVLERLSAPLCEAVTGRERCDRLLRDLERGNLFLVPLDDRRRWYRYHHLFGEMLRAHLEAERPVCARELRARASAWFEAENEPDAAVRYALDAGDGGRVAALAERFGRAVRGSFRPRTVLGWLDALPDALLRSRPLASVEYARAANDVGDLAEAERRIADAEAWLAATELGDGAPPRGVGNPGVRDDLDPHRPVRAAIATARAYLAQSRGDLPGVVEHAQRALEALPEDDAFERGVVSCLQGLAQWSRGELDAGHDAFAEGIAAMTRAGGRLGLGPTEVLADMRRAQGRLGDAERLYEEALQGLDDGGDAPMGAANLHLGRAEVAFERGDRAEADRRLARSEALGEAAVQPGTEFRWHLARAHRAQDDGDLAAALHELDEAERRAHPTPIPDVRPIPALRARVQLQRGDVAAAEAWAAARGLSADDPPSYLHEFEHLVLARTLLARAPRDADAASREAASLLLERLLRLADEQGRAGSATEILVVAASAHAAGGEIEAATDALERALRLAAPEEWLRVFTGEGPELGRLLKKAAARRPLPPFAGAVAAALRARSAEGERRPPAASRTGPGTGLGQPLLEPLTERELEVLGLIAEGLSNREIAARLFRALPTVKGYNREIFAKLQVQRRTEAIARARELGLL